MNEHATQPLLYVGTFGTHVVQAPSGRFTLAGTVPEVFRDRSFGSRDEAVLAVARWYESARLFAGRLPADCRPGPEVAAILSVTDRVLADNRAAGA